MSTEVIPAGERGSYRLTERTLIDNDVTTFAAFEVLLLEEAKSRGLTVSIEDDRLSGDMIVRWRPDHS